MIYKSFLKKKTIKKYFLIFTLISFILSLLNISRTYTIAKGNEAYKESYLYFSSEKDINLSEENNIKRYNKAIYVNCNNSLTNVYIVKDEPIKNKDHNGTLECKVNDFSFKYSHLDDINIIKNEELYELLSKDSEEYYYFITLKKWFNYNKTSSELAKKYNVEVYEMEKSIDDTDYKGIIFIIELFIKILVILFAILFLTSIVNIIIDERENNKLYHMLGYSKLKIISITFNKIILIVILPLIVLFIILLINNFIFK